MVDPPAPDEATVLRGALDRHAERRLGSSRLRELGIRALRHEAADPSGRERVPVRATYAVRSIPGRFTAREVAVRSGDTWRLRDAERQRPPWEVADMTRRRTRHFVILSPRGDDGDLDTALEQAYAQMREVLRDDALERRYLVQVAATPGQARALTANIRGVRTLTAITDTEVREEGPAQRVAEVVSQRLIVLRPNFLRADPAGRVTVLAHELAHAALAEATSGRTPAWLGEGLALYVSGDARVDEAVRLAVPSLGALGAPDAIARLGGERQAGAYAYSSAAAFFIAERFGRAKLLDLYEVFNEEDLPGEAGDPELVDAAVRRVLGVPVARLERDLRTWIVSGA